MAGGGGARGTAALPLAVVASLSILAALAAFPPASAAPNPVSGLALEEVGIQTANITFNAPSPPNVHHYNVYVSLADGNNVSDLRPAPELQRGNARASALYQTIFVFPRADAAKLDLSPRPLLGLAFDNTTSSRAAGFWNRTTELFVPSDASRVYVSITGLEPLEARYIAVAPVDDAGVENPNIETVAARALAPPVLRVPGNEGVLLSLAAIVVAIVAVFVVLWRRSGPVSRPAYLYVAPAIVALAALTFYPTAVGFVLSFTDRTLTKFGTGGFDFHYIGAANYAQVFSRPEFPLVAATTIVWTVVNVFFHVTIGLVLAVLLNRRIRARPVYRTLFLLPWAIPSYISVLAWRGMFDRPDGVIYHLFGGSIDWLGTMPWALVAVITANVWLGIPFMMMVFSGGLQSIPTDLYEAAEVDGLTRWQQFRRITLPLLKPTIVPASLLGFIWTFNMFNVIYLMTQGRPVVALGVNAGATDILITYVYAEGFSPFWRQGFAASYSVVIFFMLLAFSLSYTRYTRAMESLTGERIPREKGRIAVALGRLLSPIASRIWRPLKRALDPDQPEWVKPSFLPLALVAIGVFETWYGAAVLRGMGSWNTATAVHGIAFALIGLMAGTSAALLGGNRSFGRRLGVWALLLDLIGGLVSAPWTVGPLRLRPLWSAVLLVGLVALPSATSPPRSALASFLDRLEAAWVRLGTSFPRGRGRVWLERGLLHGLLVLFAVWSVFPLLMVIGTAFSSLNNLSTSNIPILGPLLVGDRAALPTWGWGAFETVLGRRCGSAADAPLCFPLWLRNSLIVSLGTTAWGLFVALPAGYGFSRFGFRGKRTMMLSFLVVQMFPGAIILIPYYLLMQQLRLLNNPLGLILAYSVTALPFMVWMLKGFFDTIPKDLEEAAMVDGTSQIGAFARVILPVSLPALAVTALFSFLSAWNEWLLAFTFMQSERNFTLPVGISNYAPQGSGTVFWNEYAALSLIVSIPVVILFVAFQRYLISGLTKGAVKG